MLLAQALFADPDVLLLDEPTNHLDINTIRWLEDVLNARDSTMIIISHDRHFLNSVCTHMADLDYGTLQIYPGNYDDYMVAVDAGAATHAVAERQEERADRRSAGVRSPLPRQQVQGAPGHVARQARSRRSSSRTSSLPAAQIPSSVSSSIRKASCTVRRWRSRTLAKGYDEPLCSERRPDARSRPAPSDHRPERRGQDDAAAHLARRTVARPTAASSGPRKRPSATTPRIRRPTSTAT